MAFAMNSGNRRTKSGKLSTQGVDYVWVIVSGVVNAISRKAIEEAPITREKLYALTSLVGDVHLQQFQQFHPLRIYVPAVKI